MTILVDASALVALATGEPEARAFDDAINRHTDRLYCSIGLWEAARAIGRKRAITAPEAGEVLTEIFDIFQLKIVPIGDAETRVALEARERYGKGRHPAQLNMGDCFAYACAKTNNARLLYKGDDFSKTDLA